jgi:uncharacterized iron-regulated membrane protein
MSLPLLLTTITGLLLLWRAQIEWIQPAVIPGKPREHLTSIAQAQSLESLVLKVANEVSSDDNSGPNGKPTSVLIEQVIMRPDKAVAIVRLKNQLELQFDLYSGELLKKSYRRTGWLIDLHQGSFLGPAGQYGLMFVSGLGLMFLLLSGLILFYRWRERLKELPR